ncbi:hypothetical protein [Helcococcus kunzii]|uniref:hypothetical protein n=1 Tax=Helcococcus kunzii TaxID=40091 RepID=UPI0021A27013|nr:hypothetical protein [Helcococcus kunzii]MCT1796714.1 hypothetical protein [Helcococcus kunzii]
MKTERDLLREKEKGSNKNIKNINSYSVFLYSFVLLFFEYLLLDLVLTSVNITEYKMNFTIGLFITLILISLITVLYMSNKTTRFKDAIKDSKLNMLALVIGTVAIVYLANVYLGYTIVYLSILPIILIIASFYIIAKILEKKIK